MLGRLFVLRLGRLPMLDLGQQRLKTKHFVQIVCAFVCSRAL